MTDQTLDELCVNTIRTLAMDAVQKANSGHPGMPMGCAPMAHVLWTKHLRHNPKNPRWFARDRFVLSAGHGSMLLYALLHLTGYDLELDELKNFRQWGSKTAGHPENFLFEGIETTTGPLGQGFANGVGMAIAAKYLGARYNKPGHELLNHHIYAIAGDGDLQEGISHEAASLAGHLGLGNLIYLYDDNSITIDGRTELSFTEDVPKRFEAYGWHVSAVSDGNDMDAIDKAIQAAKAETGKPSLIAIRTLIGFGSPNKQDTAKAHGSPLGDDEIKLTKANLDWQWEEPFYIPDEALSRYREAVDAGARLEQEWQARFDAYAAAHADEAAELRQVMSGDLPAGWEEAIPTVKPGDKAIASRAASGQFLNAVASRLPQLIGGSADLAPSNNTYLNGFEAFQKDTPGGRNFHFGVREHGMASALNGMALHGGVIPYGGTFLVFSDYNRPAIRLAALMEQRVIFVMTHDSIGLGEDGPTHQPVEHVAALRVIPNLLVMRPADTEETYACWRVALEAKTRPSVLALTRQGLPHLERGGLSAYEGTRRGGYVISDCEGTPDILLMGTGSEVQLARDAAARLAEDGVKARVISIPCRELFEEQDQAYRDEVLPPAVKARVAVEAGVTFGWERFTGDAGRIVGIDRFGASAPGPLLMEKMGFTVDNVLAKCRETLG